MPYHSSVDIAFGLTLYLIVGTLVMLALLDLLEPLDLSQAELVGGIAIWPAVTALLLCVFLARTAAGAGRG